LASILKTKKSAISRIENHAEDIKKDFKPPEKLKNLVRFAHNWILECCLPVSVFQQVGGDRK
jgi:hypothetical protein